MEEADQKAQAANSEMIKAQEAAKAAGEAAAKAAEEMKEAEA